MVTPANSDQASASPIGRASVHEKDAMTATVDSMREQLPPQSTNVDREQLTKHNWSVMLDESAKREVWIDGLKIGTFDKSQLPKLKEMKQVVENKLQGKNEGLGVVGRIIRTVKDVFANIFTNRKTQLKEMKALIDNHINEIERGTDLLRSSDTKEKQIVAIIARLTESGALKEEGIFRLNGSKGFIEAWKKNETVDRDKLLDFKNLTSILKDQLEVDFAKNANVEKIIKNAKNCFSKAEVDHEQAAQIRDSLYAAKPYCKELFKFFNTVVAHQDVNQMSEANLMKCIATKLSPDGLGIDSETTRLFLWMIQNPE
jgi:hypothetical protein